MFIGSPADWHLHTFPPRRSSDLLNPRDAGLFHTAFLFDDAASLAATVYRAAQDPRSRFAGSADHLVSEAFYFTDPEGNGIELYIDRPRDQWTFVDRKSTRLNSSHVAISYAVFCLKKK